MRRRSHRWFGCLHDHPNEKGPSLLDELRRELFSSSQFWRICGYLYLTFLVSVFKSYEELRYYCGSQDAVATVVRVKEEHAPEGERPDWRVTFEFRNPETNEIQRGFSTVTPDEATLYSARQKVPIEFYNESLIGSRLKGETNRLWVSIFVVSMTLCVLSTAALTWISYLEEERLRKRKWWIR